MPITLTPEQGAWIKAHVANGDYTSVEEGARRLIDQCIVEFSLREADDLGWAKPLVDEARKDVARGDVITIEEHRARNAARLAAPKG